MGPAAARKPPRTRRATRRTRAAAAAARKAAEQQAGEPQVRGGRSFSSVRLPSYLHAFASEAWRALSVCVAGGKLCF